MYLFLDVKATGVPKYLNYPLTDILNWPRIFKLSWKFYNSDAVEISSHNCIIKPVGFEIPKEISNIHSITNQTAINNGLDLKTVLMELQSLINKSIYLIGHDLNCDEKILGAEFLRNNFLNFIPLKGRISIMDSITRLHNRNGNHLYKSPSISELNKELFGPSSEKIHSNESDIETITKCFWELKRRRIINIDINLTMDLRKNLNQLIPQTQKVLKFKFKSWDLPKWYEFKAPVGQEQTIEIPLSNFPSIQIVSITKLPYVEHFLTLHEKNLNKFQMEVCQNILYKYKNVSVLYLDNSNQIYTSDFKKHFPDLYSPVFEIAENKLSNHKLKESTKYFLNLLTLNERFSIDINDPAKSGHIKSYKKDYVGFLGKSPLDLSKGKEIGCTIMMKDTGIQHTGYIFLNNVQSISIKKLQGQIYEYYILPDNLQEQIQVESTELKKKYDAPFSVLLSSKFFDKKISEIIINSNFEKNISRFSTVEFDHHNQLSVSWQERFKNQTSIYSNINLENYIPGSDIDTSERFENDFNEKYYIDDLRSDFYNDFQ